MRTLDRTYDVAKVRATIEEALTTDVKGPKVIIAQSECMLNETAPHQAAVQRRSGRQARGQERFGVDPDVCTGDHACIRCRLPLADRQEAAIRKEDPVAHVESSLRGLRQLR